jgi:hypothetical protein
LSFVRHLLQGLIFVSILGHDCDVNATFVGTTLLIKGRVHRHDAEAGAHPHFEKSNIEDVPAPSRAPLYSQYIRPSQLIFVHFLRKNNRICNT